MTDKIVSSLLPVILIFILGYWSARRGDFNFHDAAVLNRMVMLYAFPLSLFIGIVDTPYFALREQLSLALWVFFSMCGSFALSFVVCRYLFQRNLAAATLQALTIGAAAVPFFGSAILPPLLGKTSASVAISASGFAMTLIQTPICLVMLTRATGGADHEVPEKATLSQQLITSMKEPIVWAPVLAVLFVCFNVHVPRVLVSAFGLLGSTTAGIALFASGIVLYANKISVSLPVIASVAGRNLLVPFTFWAILQALGLPHDIIRGVVITLSIPVGAVVVILSVRFDVEKQESASTKFFSTIFSIPTMAFFIAALG